MDLWFELDRREKRGLQKQLRDQIASAIIEGRIEPHSIMPSSRRLAQQLDIARNTVVFAYTALREDGFLESRERSGYRVSADITASVVSIDPNKYKNKTTPSHALDWSNWLTLHASHERNIVKPQNWRDYKYCFVYGQLDPKVFPVQHWRECWRDAVGVQEITNWSQDLIDRDDELLVKQIRKRLLPRRGLWVDESQILVTVGAQNALYITLRLLLNRKRRFGIEEPGYPDARNIARVFTDNVQPLPIDKNGLILGPDLAKCDVVFTTPSHQSPTTVTMPEGRRRELLRMASEHNFMIIEDDYEAETNYLKKPLPALVNYDQEGRVIYVGSLSKTIAPGLRLGYLVGPEPFIKEARALRRLIMRHPAANNQRAAAYFLERGHHESLLRSLIRSNKQKREALLGGLQTYLPGWNVAHNNGGSSLWVTGPKGLDARELASACREVGVILEPGNIHFMSSDRPRNQFRLGYTSIAVENIDAGIKLISEIALKVFPNLYTE